MMDLESESVALDIDGTLLDYNYMPGVAPKINRALIDELVAAKVQEVALVTNQGGLPWGVQNNRRTDGRKYPMPEDFVERFCALRTAFHAAGIGVPVLRICVYHPKAPAALVEQAATLLRKTLDDAGVICDWHVYATARARKPAPFMLHSVGATVYFGDSDEDAQAAHAAGINFVHVARFVG